MLLRFFIFIQNILIPPIIPFQSWYEIYSTFSSAWTAIICFAFVFSSFSITSFLFSESNVWKNNNRNLCYSYLNMFFWSLIIFQNIFIPPFPSFQFLYEIYSTFSSEWTAAINCFAFIFSNFSSFLFSVSNDAWKDNDINLQ